MSNPTRIVLPRNLPPHWKLLAPCRGGGAYVRCDGMIVVANAEVEINGNRWVHLSCSNDVASPSLVDLQETKNLFVGPHRLAVYVLPPDAYWNGIPRCLHLWSALDGRQFPEILVRK